MHTVLTTHHSAAIPLISLFCHQTSEYNAFYSIGHPPQCCNSNQLHLWCDGAGPMQVGACWCLQIDTWVYSYLVQWVYMQLSKNSSNTQATKPLIHSLLVAWSLTCDHLIRINVLQHQGAYLQHAWETLLEIRRKPFRGHIDMLLECPVTWDAATELNN